MRNDELLTALENNIKVLFTFVGSIKNDKMLKRQVEESSSVYDYIKELSFIQKPFYERLEEFKKEEHPRIKEISIEDINISDDSDIANIAGLMRFFEKWRRKQIELIRSTNGQLWDKEAINNEYEQYNFEICVRDIVMNDSFQMYHMQELWILKNGLWNSI